MIFFNLDETLTAPKLKKWLEDILNRSYNKCLNDIEQIKMIRDRDKKATFMVFSNVYDVEDLYNQILKKGVLNSKGELLRVKFI